MSTIAFVVLLAMALGATVYSWIAIYAAIQFQKTIGVGIHAYTPPVSLLKPLCGLDRDLERNLESFCRQVYPEYEILFSVRDQNDPAVAVVRRIQEKFPQLSVQLLFTGPPRYLNAKVHGLEEMANAARHDILVISDSDVCVEREYLRSVIAPMADPKVGVTTCLSRGVPGKTVWPLLETLAMNTQFLPGVLTAWVLIGMKFSLGPTMVVRKQQMEEIGGFGMLGNYLADDFVLGEQIAKAGYRVVLSENIPEHLFSGNNRKESVGHRLRWERSSRMSRPWGYVGQIFTHPLPLALIAGVLAPVNNPWVWTLLCACIASRALLAWKVGWQTLRDPYTRRYWWLLPVSDLLNFGIWLMAFFGTEIEWRGARFHVLPGGKLLSISPRVTNTAPVRDSQPT